MKNHIGIYLRGMAMGAADIVPGVSGGTVALITGIYDRLLAALANVDLTLIRAVLRGQINDAWRHVDATFLLVLLLGIGTSILGLASGIHWLMETYPLPLWAFFFGLVLASTRTLWLAEGLEMTSKNIVAAVVGVAAALAVTSLPASAGSDSDIAFFFAGALAICAMILPGISGSFILLIIGMYSSVITALSGFELVRLGLFASGCVVGLLLFTKVLHWLIDHHRTPMMALLTGFLLGSLNALWPWQRTVATIVDRHGEERIVQSVPVLPTTFADSIGDPMLALCLVTMFAGIVLVLMAHWIPERIKRRQE